MKEELLRVLNNKLSSINSDIDALKELNKKIDEENEELSFIDSIVNLFNEENGEKNPLNFDKVVKDDFTRALDIAGDEKKKLFSSNACNYDGLVYLISGIKNGVSISLTNEQLNDIEFLIQSLTDKKASKARQQLEDNLKKNIDRTCQILGTELTERLDQLVETRINKLTKELDRMHLVLFELSDAQKDLAWKLNDRLLELNKQIVRIFYGIICEPKD